MGKIRISRSIKDDLRLQKRKDLLMLSEGYPIFPIPENCKTVKKDLKHAKTSLEMFMLSMSRYVCLRDIIDVFSFFAEVYFNVT